MKMNFQNCEDNLQIVVDSLDKEWLEKEIGGIKEIEQSAIKPDQYWLRFNPLTFRIYKAKEHLEICRSDKTRKITEEILRVALLGINISTLQKKGVVGLNEKIQLLMRDSLTSDQLEQIIYEISTASFFAAKDYQVEFLEPSKIEGRKTPDMLVMGVEIECKKKDQETIRDRRNEDFWKIIINKSHKIQDQNKTNYCIFITTKEEPTRNIVEKIIQELERLIASSMEGNYDYEMFSIKLKKLYEFGNEIPSKILSNAIESLKQDIVINEVKELINKKNGSEILRQILDERERGEFSQPYKVKNGNVIFQNIRAIGLRSNILPDRIKSIENLLNSAKKQLSNSCPGVIFVELNFLTAKQVQGDLIQLEKIIKSILRNNSRISSVIVTVEGFPEDEEKIMYYQDAIETKNPNPKFPLPPEFSIFEMNETLTQ